MEDSWPQLVTSGAMFISMILWPILTQAYNKHMKKKRKKEIITKYGRYLDEKKLDLMREANLQKQILIENLLTVEECLQIIENKRINFWDKRLDQSDFLTLRVGIGNQPLDVKVEYNEEDFKVDENELREQAENLIEKYKFIPNVPLGYSFYEHKLTAIMGIPGKTIAFVNNLLLQILTFYTYEDVKIVLFTNEQNAYLWEYLKYLNHNFNDEKTLRFFSTNKESAKTIADYLESELNSRIAKSSNKNYTPKPYYFIIMDEIDEFKRFDFVKDLTELDVNLGFSIVFIENN